MAGMLSEIGTRLAAASGLSYSLTKATNLFEGTQPPAPNVCVSLLDYEGGPSFLGFGVTDGLRGESPRLAVWCRGEPRDYDGPRNQCHTIRQNLAQVQAATLSNTFYHLIIPMQSPFLLERDKNERITMACNFIITEKEPS